MNSQQEERKQPKMEEKFLKDFDDFGRKFDHLASDLFNGLKLEQLTIEFNAKHKLYIEKLLASENIESVAIAERKSDDLLIEDMQILSKECVCQDETNTLAPGERLSSVISSNDPRKLLTDLYRRFCQASYLRLTWNKSRRKQEDNRREPLDFGRLALRLDENNFQVAYWFMISLGWYLDPIRNSRERTLVARNFRLACLRCISLQPQDPLAHHLLGRYYYNVAQLTWIERTLAKNLLGCKLEGSMEDAEREFKLGFKQNDTWLPIGLWMARLSLAQRKPMDEIKKWIDYGLGSDCIEPTSELEREELLELRSKLNISN